MGEPFPLDELLSWRRAPLVEGPALEDVVVLVEFVGGPLDGVSIYRGPTCIGCGRSIAFHRFTVMRIEHVYVPTRSPGRFVAYPARELEERLW